MQRRTASTLPVFSLMSRTAWLSQTGQTGGKHERLRVRRALLQDHAEDLRDHVAGALHNHGVADAHVLAGDLVLVVQRRILHDHAADGDRLQLRNRRQRARAADLDFDAAQDRGRLLGREFVRGGPARRARHEAQPLLQIEPVHLVDHAVDVVSRGQGASTLDLAIGGEHLVVGLAEPASSGLTAKAPACEASQHLAGWSARARRWPRPSA